MRRLEVIHNDFLNAKQQKENEDSIIQSCLNRLKTFEEKEEFLSLINNK